MQEKVVKITGNRRTSSILCTNLSRISVPYSQRFVFGAGDQQFVIIEKRDMAHTVRVAAEGNRFCKQINVRSSL